MCKIIIFAGTTEGRSLAEYLDRHNVKMHVCTATEYGESLIPKSKNIESSGTRLNREEIEGLILMKKALIVVDATHPFATVVSNNIKEACKNTNIEYLRLLRDETGNMEQLEDESMVYVNSVQEACNYLKNTTGNIFVTTGSKELKEFTKIDQYQDRIYARILSSKEAILSVLDLGFEGKNLICMQGPFTEELNYSMLKQIDAKFLVTKEAGNAGGFLEKVNAAKRADVVSIVIGRPKESVGYSYSKVIKILIEKLQLPKAKRQISVVGIGVGSLSGMTQEAIVSMKEADILFGAPRMLKYANSFQKPCIDLYSKDEIYEYLEIHKEYEKAAILVSGDVGFYSAAKNMTHYFGDYEVNYISGISSLSFFCARIGKSWEDIKLICNHGKSVNTIDSVRRNSKVFSLMGGKDSVKKLMEQFIAYNFNDVQVWVGENLGYENEKITSGTPAEIIEQEYDSLCVVYIENSNAKSDLDAISDEAFIRGNVPMTKEEIRTISIAKLGVNPDSIIYDIGAGTGSVSIQAAMKAYNGYVFAVEKKQEGVLLIEENKKKFQVSNIKAIEGIAPEALEELPIPTHAFIGGSSGNMEIIVKLLLEKNPNINIVINAITLETVTEVINLIKELAITNYDITQIQTSKSKSVGTYHMMMGQNPVFIISIMGGN
jgi:precorrin-6Y C5,15-methyltransferase (decarboxylating)